MDFTVNAWISGFNNLLPEVPTIRSLFGEKWLQNETLKFQHSTHQSQCHPLVGLLVNTHGEPPKIGYDSQFLESLFSSLGSKLSSKKIEDIKKRTSWPDFLSVLGELLIAYHLERFSPTVSIEPKLAGTSKVPDMDWNIEGKTLGIEVNTVSETVDIRADRDAYQKELRDAVLLSQLVTKYRSCRETGEELPLDVRGRLSEVEQYDKLWEDPTPRSFGGVPSIRPRFSSLGTSLTNLRKRKPGAVQLSKYKYKILALVLPSEYFLSPYAFIRVFDVHNKLDDRVRSRTSGAVYKSFYGLAGEPIYAYTHVSDTGRALGVREIDRDDGCFIGESDIDAAILCSISTSRGVVTSPLSYKFIIYEPFSLKNRPRLIPFFTMRRLIRALDVDLSLSQLVPRMPWGRALSSRKILALWRRILRPKVIRN